MLYSITLTTIILLINPIAWVPIFLYQHSKKTSINNIYLLLSLMLIQIFSYPFLEVILETKKNPHISIRGALIGATIVFSINYIYAKIKLFFKK